MMREARDKAYNFADDLVRTADDVDAL